MDAEFLYYNYLPLLADHIMDFPPHWYPEGIKPVHSYPPIYPENVKENDVFFVKVDMLEEFFANVYPRIHKRFYLLSGLGGKDVDPRLRAYLDEPNSRIIHWVGSNLVWTHPRITKIPIGFEERERCRGGPASGEGGDQELLAESFQRRKPLEDKINKLLITYIGNTHPSRAGLNEYFRPKGFAFFADKLRFRDYMAMINSYKFVLCPRGCGTDTHRFWEVLLCGSIPVVERNGLSDLYSNFPSIVVDKFQDVTEQMLNSFVYDIEKAKNVQILKLEYFTDMLKKIFAK